VSRDAMALPRDGRRHAAAGRGLDEVTAREAVRLDGRIALTAGNAVVVRTLY